MNHRVLIADDDATTRVLLDRTLQKLGYQVLVVRDGTQADRILQGPNPPHLAILDWEMPGPSGPEICARVRRRTDTGYVYVVLLTARDGRDEYDEAFAAGVDDFLTKPLNTAFLRHRLAAGVRVIESEQQLVQKQTELAEVIRNLEDLAEKRAKQLVHTERLATLGTLAAGVAHEINNPTTFISGNIKLLEDCWPTVDRALGRQAEMADTDADRIGFIREEVPGIIRGATVGVERIRRIVDGLKNYARKGSDQVAEFDLVACLDSALAICHNLLKYDITLDRKVPDTPVLLTGDDQQIEQVFINLVSNAAQALQERGAGTITIEMTPLPDTVTVTVADSGPGFADGVLDDIWKPFFTTKEPGQGTGLGLPIVQRIIGNHGGRIEAGNRPEGGAVFTVTLPVRDAAAIAAPVRDEVMS